MILSFCVIKSIYLKKDRKLKNGERELDKEKNLMNHWHSEMKRQKIEIINYDKRMNSYSETNKPEQIDQKQIDSQKESFSSGRIEDSDN